MATDARHPSRLTRALAVGVAQLQLQPRAVGGPALALLLLSAPTLLAHISTAAASASAGGNCSIRLSRTLSGSCGGGSWSGSGCPGSWSHLQSGCPWGCAGAPGQMFTIRGCCGEFVCDGVPVSCCSHEHKHPQLCQCGPPPPPPTAGGTFYVDGRAGPGGNGSASRPFATIASCAAVAARAMSYSTCRVRAGTYREAVVLGEQDGVAIIGDGVGRTVLEGTLPLTVRVCVSWLSLAAEAKAAV